MSKFIPEREHVTTFEGDEVRYKLKPLLRKDAMQLMPYIPKVGAGGEVKVEGKEAMEMLDVVVGMLPRYVTLVTAPTDANGAALTLEQITESFYFNELVQDMAAQLINDSFDRGEEKNSAAPSLVASGNSE